MSSRTTIGKEAQGHVSIPLADATADHDRHSGGEHACPHRLEGSRWIHEQADKIASWADDARDLLDMATGHFDPEEDRKVILRGVDAFLVLIRDAGAQAILDNSLEHERAEGAR